MAQAMAIPFTKWYFCGEGWPQGGTAIGYDRIAEFYRIIDVLLVPARYEGGPMPVLEALASGKEVLSPPVGFVPEFPHIEYEAGNFDALRNRIEALLKKKLLLRESVSQRTWESWALQHHALFTKLLPQNGSVMTGCAVRPVTQPAADHSVAAGESLCRLPDASGSVKTPSHKKSLRILLVARQEKQTGGPSIRIPILRRLLEAAGHAVVTSFDPAPDPTGFDVAHVFNVWAPWEALPQMRHLKSTGIPLVLSPIFLDLAESAWAAKAAMLIFSPGSAPKRGQNISMPSPTERSCWIPGRAGRDWRYFPMPMPCSAKSSCWPTIWSPSPPRRCSGLPNVSHFPKTIYGCA